jgi:hypothetical protein
MSEEEDREEVRQKEFSLLRPELDFLDLVTQGEEDCPAKLHISHTAKTHDCTRPAGHSGQHYSFSGDNEYEIIWPIVPLNESRQRESD